jgi:hypothetical protein
VPSTWSTRGSLLSAPAGQGDDAWATWPSSSRCCSGAASWLLSSSRRPPATPAAACPRRNVYLGQRRLGQRPRLPCTGATGGLSPQTDGGQYPRPDVVAFLGVAAERRRPGRDVGHAPDPDVPSSRRSVYYVAIGTPPNEAEQRAPLPARSPGCGPSASVRPAHSGGQSWARKRFLDDVCTAFVTRAWRCLHWALRVRNSFFLRRRSCVAISRTRRRPPLQPRLPYCAIHGRTPLAGRRAVTLVPCISYPATLELTSSPLGLHLLWPHRSGRSHPADPAPSLRRTDGGRSRGRSSRRHRGIGDRATARVKGYFRAAGGACSSCRRPRFIPSAASHALPLLVGEPAARRVLVVWSAASAVTGGLLFYIKACWSRAMCSWSRVFLLEPGGRLSRG